MANVVHQNNNHRLFAFLKEEKMTNVTLTAEGKMVKAHKLILAAASKYFEDLFVMLDDKHPVIVLKDVAMKYLVLILEYIYCGQVDLQPEDVDEFKKVAANLKINVELTLTDVETEIDEMSSELTKISSSELDQTMCELNEEDSMDPNFDDLMGTIPKKLSIASVKSLNVEKGAIKHAVSKQLAPDPKKIKLNKSSRVLSKSKRATSNDFKACAYCDRQLRDKDRNYHQKFCYSNPNRILSNCSMCSKIFELPSKLKVHMKAYHQSQDIKKIAPF